MTITQQLNAAMKLAVAALAVLLVVSPVHSQLVEVVAPFSCYSLRYGRVSSIHRFGIAKDEYLYSRVDSCKAENGIFCYQAVFTEGNVLRIVEKDCCKSGFPFCQETSEKK